MRVLLVIDRMIIGGAEQVFEDIISLMHSKIYIEVLLISETSESQVNRISKFVNVHLLNRKNKYSIFKLYHAYNIMKNFDVIHVHLKYTMRYVNLIRFVFNFKSSVVYHNHYFEEKNNIIDKILIYALQKFTYHITVNQQMYDKIRLYYPGINASFLLSLPKISMLDSTLRRTCDDFKQTPELDMVYVGNIKASKNQKFAANFCSCMNINLTIIGNNQQQEYWNELRRMPAVSIIEGTNVGPGDLKRFKFGIFTSYNESGPLALLEYFVCGLPFIAYRTGAISDTLFKYVPEYFMDNFVLENWVERYKMLTKDYKRIPSELIEEVLTIEFDKDLYCDKLLAIYNQCRDRSF